MKRRPKLRPEENAEVSTIIGRWNACGVAVIVAVVVAFLILPKGWPGWVVLFGGGMVSITLMVFGLYRGLTRLRQLRLKAERRELDSAHGG